MDHLNRIFRNLLHDESGQDLIEYALVAALIGLGATATMIFAMMGPTMYPRAIAMA